MIVCFIYESFLCIYSKGSLEFKKKGLEIRMPRYCELSVQNIIVVFCLDNQLILGPKLKSRVAGGNMVKSVTLIKYLIRNLKGNILDPSGRNLRAVEGLKRHLHYSERWQFSVN